MKTLYEELREERIKQQSQNVLPEWFTTNGYQIFKEKYLWEAKNFKEQAKRIAKTAASHMKDSKGWSKKFYNLLWNGYLAASTPVLSNTGTNRGLPVSCSANYVPDSVYGFYTGQVETAILSQNGFGTASDLSDIRSRGTLNSRGFKCSGILPVFKDYVQLSRDISQGGVRRGAWAGYMPIDHDDFWEVINYLLHYPDDANIGWIVTDEFIDRLQNRDQEALSRFQRSLKVKCTIGKGYYWFVDKVNRMRPECYKHYNRVNRSSNLCFTGDTLVAIADGRNAVSIKQLAQESKGIVKFPVYSSRRRADNRPGWVSEIKKAVAFKTGTQKVLKLTLSDGSTFRCTEDHELALPNGEYISAKKSLGVRLEHFYTSLGDTRKYRHINSVTNGHKKQHRMIWEFNNGEVPNGYNIDHIKNIANDKLENLQILPISEHYKKTGTEFSGSNNAVFKIRDEKIFKNNLRAATTLKNNPRFKGLSNLDIINLAKEVYKEHNKITIKLMHEKDNRMPKNLSKNRPSLAEIRNIVINNLEYIEPTYPEKIDQPIKPVFKVTELKVVSIEEDGIEDVYDLTVDDNHNFNIITSTQDDEYLECSGILVHNCTEITLSSDEDHTYTCILSSLNLAKYNEWKDSDAIFDSIVFLDCIASEFINKAKSIKGLEKAVRYTEKSRALGLGTLGYHTHLQKNNIAFESLEAHFENLTIFKHIHDQSLEATKWLAKKHGEPEWCKGFELRNTHRTAIAPNMSSSLICGSVSQGIEPIFSNVYTQQSAGGEMHRINPVLLSKMKEKGVYNDETIQKIAFNKGSVQDVDWLDENEKLVFKTAFEIDQRAILRSASVRQPFICQGQSLNLFFAAEEDEQYIAQIHKEAFLDPNIKGLYYLRSSSGVQASKGQCVACEG